MSCTTSAADSATSAFSPLRVVPMTGSTQDDLRADLTGAKAGHWPHFSALHALGQSAGRGRSGNTWTTPATGALTVSVVLRPLVPVDALAWLPLLAGLAVHDALAPRIDPRRWRLSTKWPNDVVALPTAPAEDPAPAPPEVEGWGTSRKLAGVLAELVPLPGLPLPDGRPPTRDQAPAVVLGIGVNVRQSVEQASTSARASSSCPSPGPPLFAPWGWRPSPRRCARISVPDCASAWSSGRRSVEIRGPPVEGSPSSCARPAPPWASGLASRPPVAAWRAWPSTSTRAWSCAPRVGRSSCRPEMSGLCAVVPEPRVSWSESSTSACV